MADLKGHGCTRSLKFFKVLNYQNSGLGIKPSDFIFNMHGPAKTDIITSSLPVKTQPR